MHPELLLVKRRVVDLCRVATCRCPAVPAGPAAF